MKINGKTYSGPNVEYIVIPRPDSAGGDAVFKAVAIIDMEEFHTLCPKPKPPMGMAVGGLPKADVANQAYILSMADYNERRFNFIIVFSLRGTNGLEWDTVQYSDPNSWKNYEQDLKKSGFSEREINHIVDGCLKANALNEERLEEARRRFLALMSAEQEASSSLAVAP